MPQWLLPLRVYGLILGLHPLWSAKPAAGQRSWTQGKRTGHKLGAAGQLCYTDYCLPPIPPTVQNGVPHLLTAAAAQLGFKRVQAAHRPPGVGAVDVHGHPVCWAFRGAPGGGRKLQNPHSKHLLPQLQVASIVKESIPLFTYSLIKLAFLSSETRCKFFSLTKTPEDYSIIVDEEGFLELPSSEHVGVADATWLALNVVSGTGSFSSFQPIGMTEIIKSAIAPLADQSISVSMLSTYQMDLILVHE
ncbi:unnamed protein product [Rangifer tarandus platyrhynchus]|uniref:Uncharacterized protein n=2 Tax=Rangifer tarandus platyrhynchus TaxID=3082113 RepID=A0ABN8ZIQ4_RANTA|nr:unnamed protein product [Rangifer tarandus platyrhynchus]CAI9708240.1 unnamed protein product [Rangifer tarandus platyrhynchus]